MTGHPSELATDATLQPWVGESGDGDNDDDDEDEDDGEGEGDDADAESDYEGRMSTISRYQTPSNFLPEPTPAPSLASANDGVDFPCPYTKCKKICETQIKLT